MNRLSESLTKLDPTNDEHWTTDGLPRLDAIESIHGSSVSRADITAEAPKFNRKNTNLGTATPAPTTATPATAQAANTATSTTLAANPAPAASPQHTEDKAEPNDQREADPFKLAEIELSEATKVAVEANARLHKANLEMDVLIEKREAKNSRRTSMSDIKAFQRSQAEQRAANSQRAEQVTALLREQNLL